MHKYFFFSLKKFYIGKAFNGITPYLTMWRTTGSPAGVEGRLQLDAYGVGNFTTGSGGLGAATYNLSVDADGNIIETATGGGGGGSYGYSNSHQGGGGSGVVIVSYDSGSFNGIGGHESDAGSGKTALAVKKCYEYLNGEIENGNYLIHINLTKNLNF